ncbi:MAG: hypothetical protein IJ575_11540 [Selenomonadaceae bacterium]|nr:hypothetical protein [Selenomonadaceae bacterium]
MEKYSKPNIVSMSDAHSAIPILVTGIGLAAGAAIGLAAAASSSKANPVQATKSLQKR